MWKFIKPFVIAALKQILSGNTTSGGKIRLTRFAINKMHEYTLSEKDLLDVYRYGEKKDDMIIRKYPSCTIGIIVKEDKTTNEKVIVTCWRR